MFSKQAHNYENLYDIIYSTHYFTIDVKINMFKITLQNIFDSSTIKPFGEENRNVAQIIRQYFERMKTLLEKEKMLGTSIFSFSNNVFQDLHSYLLKIVKTRLSDDRIGCIFKYSYRL